MTRGFCLSVIIVTLLVGGMVFMPASTGKAQASGWEWHQDDWTGGPGQALWADNARYDESFRMDTTSEPGRIRLSYLAHSYTKAATNPVLPRGGAGTWDEAGVSAQVRPYAGGGYEAIYRGTNAADLRALGYASSPNGVNWSKYFDNPVLRGSGSAWDQEGVGTGSLIEEAGTDSLWFRGYDAAMNYRYGYAASPDLVNWDRRADFVFGPGPAGAWDENLISSKVFRDGPLYRMYYSGYSAASNMSIGYASSPDGINWARSAANPVIGPGAPGSWEEYDIINYCFLPRPWEGDYMMAYSADNAAGVAGIGLAFSPDGEHWTKHPGNPVITEGGADTWKETDVDVNSLYFDGSIYRLFVLGSNAANNQQTGEYFSDNGTAWNASGGNPFLSSGAPGSWDENLASASRHYLEGTSLRTFYTGYGTSGFAMGTATSSPAYSTTGRLTSSVFDVGTVAQWGNVTWLQDEPVDTSLRLSIRCGNTPTPDGSWTAWAMMANGAAVPHPASRYIQYQVEMVSTGAATPWLSDLSIDFTALPSTWYFAEGYTGPGFDQWLTVQNPNPAAADLTLIYYTPGSPPQVRNHSIPGQSRMTIYVNTDLGANLENSCQIASTRPVIVERPMYYDYAGTAGHDWQGGDVAMGSTQLSRIWYFAEGYTGEGFDEWLTIQNPNPDYATVDVTYYINGGAPIERQHVVDPTSRYTINVNEDAGAGLEVSAKLSANQPILAERPVYFNYMGHIDGGHIVMGSSNLSGIWYLAEGATFAPFTEYITIQNPGADPANVVVSYLTNTGAVIVRNHFVSPGSRYTIDAGMDSGLAEEISVMVAANVEILVERPMYFDMLGGAQPGGHCAKGVDSVSADWYFGEGYTGPGFDEWLTLLNPFPGDAHIQVTYYVQGGAPIVKNHTVPGSSRYTISVGADGGDDLQLSAYIHSTDLPIIAERPMYFFYQGYSGYDWPGGSDSPGFAP